MDPEPTIGNRGLNLDPPIRKGATCMSWRDHVHQRLEKMGAYS